MLSSGETDANLWALKSRTRGSAWGLVLSRLSTQSKKMRLNSILLAWHSPQKGICCCYLLLWAFLRHQKFFNPVQRQRKAFKGFCDALERPFSWYHCTERTKRGYWVMKLKALNLFRINRLDSPSSSSLVGALSSRCWLFSGGVCLSPSRVFKDLLRKNDAICKFLRRFRGVCCCCICASWRKSAVPIS